MKKKMFILLLFLPFLSFAWPDLRVWNLEYSDSTERIVATIYNQAPEPVTQPIVIYFYDNDRLIGKYNYIQTLPRYSTVSVYINYRLDQNNHTIKAIVDPENSIDEGNEVNNDKTIFLEGKKLNMEPIQIGTSSIVENKEINTIYTYKIEEIVLLIIILFILIFVFIKYYFKKNKKLIKKETFFE